MKLWAWRVKRAWREWKLAATPEESRTAYRKLDALMRETG